jgi:hypothetical protein
MIPRLKAEIWVTAQVRVCNLHSIPFYVLHRGDPDAGMVLVKLIREAGRAVVLSPLRQMDETLAWMRATGPDPVDEAEADAYIARQRDFDPDLWAIEIEDLAQRWAPDAPIV